MRDDPPKERLPEEVAKRIRRRLKAEREKPNRLWFGLGMVGMVGWQVALPTILGAFLGRWLDGRFPGPPSWTLTFLFLGLMMGCYNAWQWVKRAGRQR